MHDQSGQRHLLRSSIDQRLFTAQGLLTNQQEFAFLNVEVAGLDNRVHLDLTKGFVLTLPLATNNMYFDAIEMCSGIGILGEGLASCGLSVRATNELRDNLCQFQVRQGQMSVIQGDIGDAATVAGLHSAYPHPSMIAAGFSCQPWSQLGDSGRFADARSGSLHKVLEGAYLDAAGFVSEL